MNKIWSTIATDCNQDGHTATPITAPSSSQQEELLKRIYSENRVDPGDIHVIEAHGKKKFYVNYRYQSHCESILRMMLHFVMYVVSNSQSQLLIISLNSNL